MCVAWHTCLKLTRTHARTHTQRNVQHPPDVHMNAVCILYTAHTHYRHTGTYLQTILPPSFKCKTDQTLSIFPISNIHNAFTTQWLFSRNRTKAGEVWNVHVKVGAIQLTDGRLCFTADVKFVASQYMNNVVVERVRVSCTNRACVKPWICL